MYFIFQNLLKRWYLMRLMFQYRPYRHRNRGNYVVFAIHSFISLLYWHVDYIVEVIGSRKSILKVFLKVKVNPQLWMFMGGDDCLPSGDKSSLILETLPLPPLYHKKSPDPSYIFSSLYYSSSTMSLLYSAWIHQPIRAANTWFIWAG